MDITPPLASIGIDIGKEVFHVVGFSIDGKIAFRRKIKRLALCEAFKNLSPCIVGMEACLSAHFVSRTLRQLGHEPRIIPAIYVKPFVKGQKNDYNDAEAIAEAALRPNLHTVQEKSQDQLDLQACHRLRSRFVSRRTARDNGDHAAPRPFPSPGRYRLPRHPCSRDGRPALPEDFQQHLPAVRPWLGAELGGIGGPTQIWTFRGRGTVPF
jgi:transposase